MSTQPTPPLSAPDEAIAAQAPETLEDLLAEGARYHVKGAFEEAEAIYRIVLGSEPENPDALHLMGVLASDVGRPDVAIDLIQKSIAVRPDFAEAHHNLAVAALRQQDFTDAEAAFRQSLSLDPDNARSRSGLACALSSLGRHEEAIPECRSALALAPDLAEAHFNLSNALKHLGKVVEAADACREAQRLRPDLPGLTRQIEDIETLLGQDDTFETAFAPLDVGTDARFRRLIMRTDSNVLTGVSSDATQVIKIELRENPLKRNAIAQEAEIMDALNAADCVSCPTLIVTGTMPRDQLLPCLGEPALSAALESGRESFPYLVQAYVKDNGAWTAADMLLAYLEQKSLGIYQGDPKPENLRFDPDTGICYLVDYDQAERLDETLRTIGNLEFFDWCAARSRSRFGFESWLTYFPQFSIERDVRPLFRDSAFNVGATTLYRRQQTTMGAGGIYHSLNTDRLYADGERDLGTRRSVLDTIGFADGERVLDIGCNAGLLSMYLEDRGCAVDGVDLDPSIILADRMIAHILGRKVRFACLDLDGADLPGDYDTVMLFSVIHHTRNLEENARKIAARCTRIVIECRLDEAGAKPENGTWSGTSRWKYESVEALVTGLERLFPGFRLEANHGQVDRGRYILELRKG